MSDKNPNWQDVVAASKKEKGPLYTRYINRNAAIPLTYVFWKLGLSPNVITGLSGVVTHVGLLVLLITPVSLRVAMLSYALLAIGFVLDSCDGQLARVRGASSLAGEWYDHTLDLMKLINFNLAVGYILMREVSAETPLFHLAIAAFALNTMSHPMLFFGGVLWSKMPATIPTGGTPAKGKSLMGRIRRAAVTLTDYGLRIMLVLAIPWIEPFLVLYFGYGCFMSLVVAGVFLETRRRYPV